MAHGGAAASLIFVRHRGTLLMDKSNAPKQARSWPSLHMIAHLLNRHYEAPR